MKSRRFYLSAVVFGAIFVLSSFLIAFAQTTSNTQTPSQFTTLLKTIDSSTTKALTVGTGGAVTTLLDPQCVSACFFDGFDVNTYSPVSTQVA